jgi:hypothetical protein
MRLALEAVAAFVGMQLKPEMTAENASNVVAAQNLLAKLFFILNFPLVTNIVGQKYQPIPYSVSDVLTPSFQGFEGDLRLPKCLGDSLSTERRILNVVS